MSDISTIWNPAMSFGDWQMNGPQLLTGNDLDTAVLISIFTDRVALPGDIIPDGTTDRRGWWGDNLPDGTTMPIGSRLWLLSRSNSPTQQVLNQAITYAQEALQWMITDGVCAAVNVDAQWNADNFLAMVVTIQRNNGSIKTINFTYAWDQII